MCESQYFAGGHGTAFRADSWKKLMATIKRKSYKQALKWLCENGFTVQETSRKGGPVSVKKYNCSAVIEKNPAGAARLAVFPGNLVGGEVSKLVDAGYQKFLMTSKGKLPATADHLKDLHRFSEELKEAMGASSLYNESLGSVSESCHYDRVKDRDLAEAQRPQRPWEQ